MYFKNTISSRLHCLIPRIPPCNCWCLWNFNSQWLSVFCLHFFCSLQFDPIFYWRFFFSPLLSMHKQIFSCLVSYSFDCVEFQLECHLTFAAVFSLLVFPLTRNCLPISTSVCYANTVKEMCCSSSWLSSKRIENRYDSCSLFTWNRDCIESNARWLSIARFFFWPRSKWFITKVLQLAKKITHELFTALL